MRAKELDRDPSAVFLGDVPVATAILDRFLAHATIVQMTGKSSQRPAGARVAPTTEAVDAVGAVDAQHAPTAQQLARKRLILKTRRDVRVV